MLSGLSYANSDNLDFLVGVSPGFLNVRTPSDTGANYTAIGLSTGISYKLGQHKIGMMSKVLFGQKNNGQDVMLSSLSMETDERIQFSNFTPYYQYNPSFLSRMDSSYFIKLGTTSTLTTFRFRKQYDEDKKPILRKSTMSGRGIDVSVGWERGLHEGSKLYEIAINYIQVNPGKPKLVDVTDFTNAITLTRVDERPIEKVQVFMLSFNQKLF